MERLFRHNFAASGLQVLSNLPSFYHPSFFKIAISLSQIPGNKCPIEHLSSSFPTRRCRNPSSSNKPAPRRAQRKTPPHPPSCLSAHDTPADAAAARPAADNTASAPAGSSLSAAAVERRSSRAILRWAAAARTSGRRWAVEGRTLERRWVVVGVGRCGLEFGRRGRGSWGVGPVRVDGQPWVGMGGGGGRGGMLT